MSDEAREWQVRDVPGEDTSEVLVAHHSVVGDVTVGVDDRDTMRWWTRLSMGGLAAAIVLAIIGGLPVGIPMPTHAFGWVEPSCGLTRGSTAIAGGDLALAWRYNPLSFLVIAFGLAGVARAFVGAVTGRWMRVDARPRAAGWVLVAIAVLVLWVHQQGNADFIIHSGH